MPAKPEPALANAVPPLRGLHAIRRGSVALDAVNQIKQMIIRGELGAGQRMPTERELAEQLGVSRPTIRESLRALVALNIVEPVHGAGTYVSSLEPDLLAEPIDFLLQVNQDALGDLFDARMVLEAGLARLAALRHTAVDLAALGATVAEHGAHTDDRERAMALDFRFHAQLAAAAHSPILSSLLSSISALGRASRARTGRSPAIRQQAHVDHLRLLDALRTHDPDAAETAMVAHLEHVRLASAESPARS